MPSASPLNERLATHLLASLNIWPLLQGFRGRPHMNVENLLEVIMRFSYLVADFPEIQEIDVNPQVVTPEERVALDARVVVDSEALQNPPRPYSHLVIRPYPEGYEREVTLKDGTPVLLRPICPEDEPLWHEMLAVSSRESIRSGFRYIFRETPHQVAIPYCFIDYAREMAIVGIVEEGGQKRMVGVGRLITDPDQMKAEYAVFVADPWQNRGLGGILTDYALGIAKGWGVREVTAETTPDNPRMIRIFEKHGFARKYRTEESVVRAAKLLDPSK